jgi:hypothetical protein
MAKVDFGVLTEEQTAVIAIEALENLTTEKRIEVVLTTFEQPDEREELLARLAPND